MDLMQYIPLKVYNQEEHVQDFQQAIAEELKDLLQERDLLYQQIRPSTATWGLRIYEKEYGLMPDSARTDAQRLASIRAKKRGQGTTTETVLQKLVKGFTDGIVEIKHYPKEHCFDILFINKPSDKTDHVGMQRAIDEIKPAHLAYGYKTKVNTSHSAKTGTFAHACTTCPIQLNVEKTHIKQGVRVGVTNSLYTNWGIAPPENYTPPYSKPNLLYNSAFANDAEGWVNLNGGKVITDAKFQLFGGNSIKIVAENYSEPSYSAGRPRQELYIPCRMGDTFTASVYFFIKDICTFQTGAPLENIALEINYFDKDYKRLHWQKAVAHYPTKKTEGSWQRIALTHTVPQEDIVFCRLLFMVHVNGTAWFACPKLEHGTEVTPYFKD